MDFWSLNITHKQKAVTQWDGFLSLFAIDIEKRYTLNEAPQPHVVVAFGLLTKKRDPSNPSV